MRTAPRAGSLMALCLALAFPAMTTRAQDTGGTDVPEWVKKLAIDPESPAAKRYAEQQRVRLAAERQLRKIRLQHFGTVRNPQIRQEGIMKVREFTDPALFASMVGVFGREGLDVKTALLDQFLDSATPEGDAAMAWIGVFDGDAAVRAQAEQRLRKRIAKEGRTPDPVKLVVYEGLRASDTTAVASAARFAAGMDIIEAIPWLIAAQLQGAPQVGATGTGGGSRDGALAWIMVGQQTAFVSDLQPVVGPSAVAFDPQLSVVNEGVILRVLDAVVVQYNVDVHNALIDLTSRQWGQNTQDLGWNVPAWRRWYAQTFVPYWRARQAEAAADKPIK